MLRCRHRKARRLPLVPDLVAPRDTNQTSGRRWIHNAGQHISLFVAGVKDQIALKLIAAKGKVQLQAQSDDVEITADKNVKITACKEKVEIAAGDEVLLTSGGGYIRLKGGNIEIHCPGMVSIKGASHELSGGTSMQKTFPNFKAPFAGHFKIEDNKGKEITNQPYMIELPGGNKIFGKTDFEGKSITAYTSESDNIQILPIFSNLWEDEEVNVEHTEMRDLWEKN